MNNINTSVKYSCRKTIISIIAAAALLLAFSGCFSPWEGDGTLTINLGGGGSSRAVISPDEIANFEYEIILEGPGGKITKTVKGGGAITLELAPGTWDLMLRAIGDRPEDSSWYSPSLHFPKRMLRALGFDNAVDVKAGRNNNVTLEMKAATEVFNEDQFDMANTGLSDKPEIFVIKESFEYNGIFKLEGQDLTLITDNTDKEVTLTFTNGLTFGDGIFTLFAGIYPPYKPSTLTLGRPGMKGWLVIDGGGKEGNVKHGSLFRVKSECKLEMFEGVKLCNNINDGFSSSGGLGGGVHVEYGEFIMHGGKISGNKATAGGLGGGVYVYDGAVFTMNGGVISGNEAEAYGSSGGMGGGVFVDVSSIVSTFIMNGGEISGNKALATSFGGGGLGGGVSVAEGRFEMRGGEIAGNEADKSGGGVRFMGSGSVPDNYFYKTGGVIYGDDDERMNKVNDNSNGKAVSCYDGKYRNDSVWDNISYDASRLGEKYSGIWDEP